ncbi:MAG: hypothetical protein IPP08_01605 [Chlorobiota bacterium]|jgi:hypothetical protein|nr:hypothetical protein [Chlorobiota bacterium]QQS66894.1 MAG: hypothetical protein IPP08_01605 [Chlorobiota bacterium]
MSEILEYLIGKNELKVCKCCDTVGNYYDNFCSKCGVKLTNGIEIDKCEAHQENPFVIFCTKCGEKIEKNS